MDGHQDPVLGADYHPGGGDNRISGHQMKTVSLRHHCEDQLCSHDGVMLTGATVRSDAKGEKSLAPASWCATIGEMRDLGGVFSGEIPHQGSDFCRPIGQKARMMNPQSSRRETHHARNQRPSNDHHSRPRQQ